MLPLFAILELVKRIASALLYPLAYALRHYARKDTVLWPEYLFYPKFTIAWLFLDDSVLMEFGKEYGDREKYYPAFVWGTGNDFIKAYWWAAIRNSCVNWNNFNAWATGEFIRVVKRYGTGRNFYEVRQFTIGNRPYSEFWIFNRRNQIGWIKKGRFEIDVMKRII